MRDKQIPIHSDYGPRTTAREVLAGIDLSGKVAVVTGGYGGIGLETTRVLEAYFVLSGERHPQLRFRMSSNSAARYGIQFGN